MMNRIKAMQAKQAAEPEEKEKPKKKATKKTNKKASKPKPPKSEVVAKFELVEIRNVINALTAKIENEQAERRLLEGMIVDLQAQDRGEELVQRIRSLDRRVNLDEVMKEPVMRGVAKSYFSEKTRAMRQMTMTATVNLVRKVLLEQEVEP